MSDGDQDRPARPAGDARDELAEARRDRQGDVAAPGDRRGGVHDDVAGVGDRRDRVIAKLQADLDALREQKDLEVASVRRSCEAEVAEVHAREYEFRQRIAADERRIVRLAAKLDEVYTSRTWRIGRILLWLPRKLTGRPQPPTRRPRR